MHVLTKFQMNVVYKLALLVKHIFARQLAISRFMFVQDFVRRLSHWLMLKVDSYIMIAAMLLYSLHHICNARGVAGKFTTTCQGIVTIIERYSNHALLAYISLT